MGYRSKYVQHQNAASNGILAGQHFHITGSQSPPHGGALPSVGVRDSPALPVHALWAHLVTKGQ